MLVSEHTKTNVFDNTVSMKDFLRGQKCIISVCCIVILQTVIATVTAGPALV